MSSAVASATATFVFMDPAATGGPMPSFTPEFLAQDLGPSLLTTASLFIFLSTLFVILRYYARYLTQTRFGPEDIVIPLAWLSETGVCATSIVMVEKADTGRHLAFVNMSDPGKVMEHFRGIMVLEILHVMAVAFPKFCVVILYLHVFTNKWTRIGSWVAIGLIAGTWFSYTIATLFQCMPFAYNWDKSIEGGHCFDTLAFAHSSSVPNIFTDLLVVFLPIRTILDLKVSRGKRIGLFLIFMVGSVGIIASIIRTIVFAETDPLGDVTFTNVALVQWTIIEPGMYLMAACGLSYKPLFRMLARALHLDQLLTYTHSRKHGITKTTRTGTFGTTQVDMELNKLKSARHGGFDKLDNGPDGALDKDIELGHVRSKDSFNIVVTKTVEIQQEERREDEDEDEWGLKDGLRHQQPNSRFST